MKKLSITIMTLFLITFRIYAGEIIETDNVTYSNSSVSIVGTGQLNLPGGGTGLQAATVDEITAAIAYSTDGAYQTNRPFALTCVVNTNDPSVYILGPAVSDLLVTNLQAHKGADSVTYNVLADGTIIFTNFAYTGTTTNLPVSISISGGAQMEIDIQSGSPTNSGFTLWGTY